MVSICINPSGVSGEGLSRVGVRAIEMEGSGIMDAGWAMDKDIMVVGGVCDYCDDHKSHTWQR